jgi:hypothetical protein
MFFLITPTRRTKKGRTEKTPLFFHEIEFLRDLSWKSWFSMVVNVWARK